MNTFLRNLFAGLCLILISACSSNEIEGIWQYDGGVYNGKTQKASTEFRMQRTYSSKTYKGFLLEGETEPQLYNSGNYEIIGDSLLITSKFSSQPSVNDNITITYTFRVSQDKMTTNGVLPNGMVVEEYWKKLSK